ncbi:HipA domain-containing protein [Microbacterium aurum]
MHAKNIGLLHYPDGGVVLAPMYDVIPSADLNVDQSFALAVNGRREADEITLADVAAEGRSWSIRQPERIVAEVAEVVVETARVERLPQYR